MRHPGVAAVAHAGRDGELAEDGCAEARGGGAEEVGRAVEVVGRRAGWAGEVRLVQKEAEDLRADEWGEERAVEGEGRTGTEILRNMATPLRTSESATSCGVETITAPATNPFPISVTAS